MPLPVACCPWRRILARPNPIAPPAAASLPNAAPASQPVASCSPEAASPRQSAMAKKKHKKKSPNQKTPMPVKVILGVASPRNSVLLPTSPQTPLTVESESPPPPKEILNLKKPSCSEDEDDEACSENEDDEASVKSFSVQTSSSSEEFSSEDEVEEDSADEESSSSESGGAGLGS
ncbi:hypothetical protein OIU79_022124 [Salix purpurea]|uniref:Uncharacterized protein n=1 Tax=Salix purpurea TaxID=77065 RepID=A0A9Q1ACF8_SALPP|nr:hypothetical protein OIU79_022124 [Salix purpurea]